MFQAGFARVDITPPLKSPLAGYFSERYADNILDPLELNAIAVSDGETVAVFVAADLIYVREKECNQIRKMVAERIEVPFENVFLQGLHQHTSVRIGGKPGQISNMEDQAYLDLLYRKYCDVAQLAVADLADAKVGVASCETAEPISFVRRYRMKDGSTRTNPGVQNPDVVGPLSEADNTVRLIRFFREGKKDIAFVNFSTHPDVIGGTNISADWPGFVRRLTEADLDVYCLSSTGAQGDTNHLDVTKPLIARKGDPDYFEKRYAYSRYMGRMIADAVLKIWDKTEEKCPTPVTCHNRIDYIPTNTKYIDEIERFQKMKEEVDAGNLKLQLGPLAEMHRVLRLHDQKLFQKVPTSLLGMGKVAVAGIGGEPFTWYAQAAREAAPNLFVITACLVNGGEGYLPTKDAFEEGGYEAMSTNFTVCVAEKIPTSIAQMLSDHQKQ